MSEKPEDLGMSNQEAAWYGFWILLFFSMLGGTAMLAVAGNLAAIGTAIVVHAILSNIDKILE